MGEGMYTCESNIRVSSVPCFSNIRVSLTVCLCLFFWRNSPKETMASSFTRFIDHTQRRTTVGRIPLDE